jgi:hypothetical protein
MTGRLKPAPPRRTAVGMVTAGDIAGTGNTGLLKGEELIKNSVA